MLIHVSIEMLGIYNTHIHRQANTHTGSECTNVNTTHYGNSKKVAVCQLIIQYTVLYICLVGSDIKTLINADGTRSFWLFASKKWLHLCLFFFLDHHSLVTALLGLWVHKMHSHASGPPDGWVEAFQLAGCPDNHRLPVS